MPVGKKKSASKEKATQDIRLVESASQSPPQSIIISPKAPQSRQSTITENTGGSASRIILVLGKNKIPAASFVKAVRFFTDLIEGVSQEFITSGRAVNWMISVQAGSALIIADAEPVKLDPLQIPLVVEAIGQGVGLLEEGPSEIPPYFADKALNSIRALALLTLNGVGSIRLRVDDQLQPITASSISSVQQLIGDNYSAIGTVEGKLQIISVRRKHEFFVFNAIDDRRVSCEFSSPLMEDVVNALGKRVSARGMIQYRRDGTPNSIEVETLKIFPLSKELPSFANIIGAFNE